MDQSTSVITEINAKAEAVPESAVSAMEEAVLAAARESSWLVLTGSLPKDFPTDFYARLIRRVREEGIPCRVALDAEGAPLTLGVAEKPDFIKPNRHELELLVGRAADRESDGRMEFDLPASDYEMLLIQLDESGLDYLAEEYPDSTGNTILVIIELEQVQQN